MCVCVCVCVCVCLCVCVCVCVCLFSILPPVFNVFPSYSSQRQYPFTIKTTSCLSK